MRGNDRGKDFDQQFNQSKRQAKKRQEAGEGPYAADKYLSDLNNRGNSSPPSKDSCLVAGIALLSALIGTAYGVVEYLI